MCWEPRPRWRKPHAFRKDHHRKATRGPLIHLGNPGACRSQRSAAFLFPAHPRDRLRQTAPSHRAREARHRHQKEGSMQAASKETQDDKYFCQSMVQKTIQQVQGSTHLKLHHNAICMVDVEHPQQVHFKFYQSFNGCVICSNTIPKEYIKKRLSTPGTDLRHESRHSRNQTVTKNVGDSTAEKDKAYRCCRSVSQVSIRELEWRLKGKQVPRRSGSTRARASFSLKQRSSHYVYLRFESSIFACRVVQSVATLSRSRSQAARLV